MLKKLIAYEWRASWKLMAAVNALVLLLALMGMFLFSSNAYQNFEQSQSTWGVVGMVLYMIFFFISVGALSFVVCLFFYIRFFQNLYTDQGYLMQTLPVTPRQLILSKGIVGMIWNIISAFVVLLSVFIGIFALIGAVDGQSFWGILTDLMSQLEITGQIVAIVVAYIVLIFVSGALNMLLGYTAVSVGQLFRKQKVIGSILAYIGIYTVIQVFSAILTVFGPLLFGNIAPENEMNVAAVVLFVCAAVIALIDVGLFFVVEYIMKNKLNLD